MPVETQLSTLEEPSGEGVITGEGVPPGVGEILGEGPGPGVGIIGPQPAPQNIPVIKIDTAIGLYFKRMFLKFLLVLLMIMTYLCLMGLFGLNGFEYNVIN